MTKYIDLMGKRFGFWTVLREAQERRSGQVAFWCLCDCGNVTMVRGSPLRKGRSKNCGCVARKAALGVNIGFVKHDMWKTVENKTWHLMRNRCSNPRNDAYATHGGRGIRVCEEWDSSFEAFLRDVGMRPSPDHRLRRLDTNGDFEPGNCGWVHKSVSFARTPLSAMSCLASKPEPYVPMMFPHLGVALSGST